MSRRGPTSIQKGMNAKTRLVALLAGSVVLALSGCVSSSRTSATLGVGGGHYKVKSAGGGSGEARAGLVEAAFESLADNDFGGGVRVRGIRSDDDLDGDGAGPGSATLQATDGEWYFHGTYDGADGVDRMPLRFGLSLRRLKVEDTSDQDAIEWNSVGPRAELAPEWAISQWGDDRLAVCGLVGVGYGFTNIQTNLAATDFETSALFLDLGLGVRATLNGLILDLGYRYSTSHYSQSEVASSAIVVETDADFSGLVFTIGGRF